MAIFDPTAGLAPTAPEQRPHAPANSQHGDFERTIIQVDAGKGRTRAIYSGLTRKGMEDALRAGRSIMIDGVCVTNTAQLPTEAEMAIASGDPGELEKKRRENDALIDQLRAENQALKTAAGGTKPSLPASPEVAPIVAKK